MTKFDEEFKENYSEFLKISKRILQNRPLSTNATKLNEYRDSLINSYNNILLHVKGHSESCEFSEVQVKLTRCKDLLSKCFIKLNSQIKIPIEPLALIFKTDLANSDSEEEYFDAKSQASVSFAIKRSASLPSIKDSLSVLEIPASATSSPNFSIYSKVLTEMATAEQKKSFISLCASINRENYSGDPLALESFLDKISLIEDLAEENLTSTLIAFLKSKLEGKAREAIPTQINSVSDIKSALRNRIKPDNSKVVAGKIAALHVNNNNYSDFAKRVQELSDSLERSLIIEGMTQEKAHEMAIEQTVNVCRLNARSDLVKSILASTKFSDSKDVVEKLIVEQNNEVKERQVLTFRSRGINTFRNSRGGYRGTNPTRNFTAYRNNRSFSSNNNNFNSYNSQRYRPANENRYHNNNNGSRVNSNNNTNRNNNARTANGRSRNAKVRALNALAPQERTLGEQE
ncbi:PREDICTED: putative uncharacterized protein DDB_G0277255 [Rhagoletis zephyria]|uniref:putative uncharacterized protein DDB_G0277255 n=1 Tax=Rhagoletis zephyria TaxID=28612 RepID=UPI0008114766|nr:PREDICTED: putative uncharacterized protein DDB_G0277255 [Rhagoletis zephyria]